MENSPLVLSKPQTRYEAAKRAPANAAAPVTGHVRRHDIHQTNRTLRRASGRPVGTTQDGASDSDDAPETDAAADGFVNGSSAGRLPRAVVSCGDASNAPVRAAGTDAGRSSERRPARRATSRRGAHFTPGATKGRGIGRNGGRGKTGTGTDGLGGAITVATAATAAIRSRFGRDARRACRPPTPASSSAGRATSNRSGNGDPRPVHQLFAQNPCIVTVGSTTRCTTP